MQKYPAPHAAEVVSDPGVVHPNPASHSMQSATAIACVDVVGL